MKVWSAREVNTFLVHVANDRLFACWRLIATTGMRRGELLGLTWQHVNLEAGSLEVKQQLVPTRGGATIGPPKTARSERTVSLDIDTVAALREHRDTQLLERALMGDVYLDGDFVFCHEDGRFIDPQRLTEWAPKLVKAAGLSPLQQPLHGFRHTHITLGLLNACRCT